MRSYLPSAIFENYVAEIRLDGKAVQLALWDTASVSISTLIDVRRTDSHWLAHSGQEEYEVCTRR